MVFSRVTGFSNVFACRAGQAREFGLNPIALLSFGSRIGPWLGRTVSANPGLLTTLLTRLSVGGKFAGSKVADIVQWAKASPAGAIFLASTLASLGFSVASLFGDEPDAAVAEFKTGLDDVAQNAFAQINAIGAKSEAAAFGSNTPARQVQDEVAIEVLSWARGFFGSVSLAVEAHRMHQAFVEMPLAEVQHGFSVYKLR